MLEILLLIGLWKAIGSLVEQKGRPALPFQILVIVMWIGGEFFGAFVGAVLTRLNNDVGVFNFKIYFCALAGAAIGAGLLFLIAACLPEVREGDDFDEERFRRWQKKRRKRQKSGTGPREDDERDDERSRYSH
jgi:hypothetical protein